MDLLRDGPDGVAPRLRENFLREATRAVARAVAFTGPSPPGDLQLFGHAFPGPLDAVCFAGLSHEEGLEVGGWLVRAFLDTRGQVGEVLEGDIVRWA